jgi:hypothetical protein
MNKPVESKLSASLLESKEKKYLSNVNLSTPDLFVEIEPSLYPFLGYGSDCQNEFFTSGTQYILQNW